MNLIKERKNDILLALFWPFFGLCFYALEWLVPNRSYYIMYHPLDDLIPFCEWFLVPYLFWFVFMVSAYVYTFFAEPEAFRRLMQFTILTYGGGLLMFLLFPTCQNLRPVSFERDNLLTEVMAWFYTCDTSTNVCPSLHVCGSIAAALGLTDTKRFSAPGRRAMIWIIALMICLSTVFVKQHSVIDTICGFAFSGFAWVAVYQLPRYNRHPVGLRMYSP